MSAYEEIRNQLSKEDKNGFSLWKKVVAGMMAGGKLLDNNQDYNIINTHQVLGS